MVPTAEDFKNKEYGNVYWDENSAVDFAIEFAKLHVQAALEKASEVAEITDNGRFPYIDKKSILNSYSLKNIK